MLPDGRRDDDKYRDDVRAVCWINDKNRVENIFPYHSVPQTLIKIFRRFIAVCQVNSQCFAM